MQMSFVNKSNSPAWIVYYGLDPEGNHVHLADNSGHLKKNPPSQEATDAMALPVTGNGTFEFPLLNAARLYVGLAKALRLDTNDAGAPTPPASADPTNANYAIPWDFFESTYIPVAGQDLFNFNLSNVQSANLPLSFHVTGSEPSNHEPVDYTRGWLPGGYSAFLAGLRANNDFAGLILDGSQRVLAPGTAITGFEQGVIKEPLFATDYLDGYIAKVWDKFTSKDLTFQADPLPNTNEFVTWTGRVVGDDFIFTTNVAGLEPIILSVPTTADLLENNFNFCQGGCGDSGSNQQTQALQLFGTLCAAFNRSVMLTTTELTNNPDGTWCRNVNDFYQYPITNHYSKEVHANAVDGLAYAFQSDDHCDVSSYVAVANPHQLTITLDPLG